MVYARPNSSITDELLTFGLAQTTNKRCQEWTMEYIRHLVSKGYIGAQAIQIVQSKRDPPTHGIGLRRVAA